MSTVRVLIIDDSPMVRMILKQGLEQGVGIEVVGVASDPFEAREKIAELKPDVLTLDMEMPRMSGYTFLTKLMPQYPLPVIMVSSLTQRGAKLTMECLEAGAIDFVAKPNTGPAGLASMILSLREKVLMAAKIDVSHHLQNRAESSPQERSQGTGLALDWLVLIGASTGGTEALRRVLMDLPKTMPPIVVVQHMPPGYTRHFADRLNQICSLNVEEARDAQELVPGLCLVAPGGKQLHIGQDSLGRRIVRVREEGKISGHCPSVDVLFESARKVQPRKTLAVILTGMGADGAEGMLGLRQDGARTLGQDMASSVVYGMPRAAFEKGAVENQVPLQEIGARIQGILRKVS